MEEKKIDTGIVDKAIAFAVRKHSGTPRKGTKIPYIVHPMEAAAIVAGMTDDQELIAAALLHDTLEDTGTFKTKGRFSCLGTNFYAKHAKANMVKKKATSRKNGSMMKSAQGEKPEL